MLYVYSMQIIVCEMIKFSLLEIWLKYTCDQIWVDPASTHSVLFQFKICSQFKHTASCS